MYKYYLTRIYHKDTDWYQPTLCFMKSNYGIPIGTSIPLTEVEGYEDKDFKLEERDNIIYLILPDGREISTEVKKEDLDKWNIYGGSSKNYYERIK